MKKQRSSRNQTLEIGVEERAKLSEGIVYLPTERTDILNKIMCGDIKEGLRKIPEKSVDLAFIDPPYNLTKQFNTNKFRKMTMQEYIEWMDDWFKLVIPLMKPEGSVYVCGDWVSTPAIYEVMSKYLNIQNRITWEREKGRGALSNWKNASEDIWFGTMSKNYYFNVDTVKLKRKVLAPYKENGKPKDWEESEEGNFRLTFPSNVWSDLTVPFWSMPENTEHPTQKPEKLVAKVILASSREGDVVLDPFMGSGTTAVVAKKLGRNFYGVEKEEDYCMFIQKRLEMAEDRKTIQGYKDGVFWDRNAGNTK